MKRDEKVDNSTMKNTQFIVGCQAIGLHAQRNRFVCQEEPSKYLI